MYSMHFIDSTAAVLIQALNVHTLMSISLRNCTRSMEFLNTHAPSLVAHHWLERGGHCSGVGPSSPHRPSVSLEGTATLRQPGTCQLHPMQHHRNLGCTGQRLNSGAQPQSHGKTAQALGLRTWSEAAGLCRAMHAPWSSTASFPPAWR